MKYELNAENKKFGRLATEVAVLLMGKNKSDFARNIAPEVKVHISNLSKISITDKKKESTLYKRFSGYPGGLKVENLSELEARKGLSDAFKKTVMGMLPKNKLRAVMIKNLVIKE